VIVYLPMGAILAGRMPGRVEQIAIAPVKEMLPEPVERVEVLAGQGPRGDRKFASRPAERKGKDLTLIEAEALEAFSAETGIELSHEESRRNVLTRGVRLNDLVGRRFRVGEVECVGVVLNEPCVHLESLTYPGVLKGLVHRGGLRANVVRSGTIAVGDEVLATD
jgi:MOSC domain-containing protein YiiM